MAYTPNFSCSQQADDTGTIVITDSGSGSDATISSRNIYCQLADGRYMTLDGIVDTATAIAWASFPSVTTLTLTDLLDRARSLRIRVDWVTSAGAVVVTKTLTFCFNLQDYVFALGLTADQVADNSITQDSDWHINKMKFVTNDQDAENAITYGENISLSQNALDRNYLMISNSGNYF